MAAKKRHRAGRGASKRSGRTWENKVQSVIGKLSQVAYAQTNLDPSGKRYKTHRPYRLPDEANDLVQILGLHDRKDAEHRAKAYMEGLRRRGLKID